MFFALPPAAFLMQEIAERAMHTEPGLGRGALLHLLVGLLLQLPLAFTAFLVAWAVLDFTGRIIRMLQAQRSGLRLAGAVVGFPSDQTSRSRQTLLALGHPQRGPPQT
jgi:hypothetical protein